MSLLGKVINVLPKNLRDLYLASEPSSRHDYEDFMLTMFPKSDTPEEAGESGRAVLATAVPLARFTERDLPDITVHEFMELLAERGYPDEAEMASWGQFGRTLRVLKPFYPYRKID